MFVTSRPRCLISNPSRRSWISPVSTSWTKDTKRVKPYAGGPSPVEVDVEPVYFDADAELENVVQGQINGRVPSKKIVGFVQLAPTGIPLTAKAFNDLLALQLGSIGAPSTASSTS